MRWRYQRADRELFIVSTNQSDYGRTGFCADAETLLKGGGAWIKS